VNVFNRSIHGMSNVTDPKQGFLLKAIWTCVVVASFVCAGICIKESIDGEFNFLLMFMIFKFSYPLSDVVVFIKRRVFSIKEIKDKTVNYGKFNHTCKIMITA